MNRKNYLSAAWDSMSIVLQDGKGYWEKGQTLAMFIYCIEVNGNGSKKGLPVAGTLRILTIFGKDYYHITTLVQYCVLKCAFSFCR